MNFRIIKPKISFGEEIVELSTLDQQASRRYVDTLLIFQHTGNENVSHTVQNIENALSATLCELPDFAATVIPVLGSDRGELELRIGPESGVPFRILTHHEAGEPSVSSPFAGMTYSELAKGNFPFGADCNHFLFFPRDGFLHGDSEGLPVLLIQVNLVEGGLFIGVSFHHTLCDGHSMDYFLTSWARHANTPVAHQSKGPRTGGHREACDRWRLSHGRLDGDIAELPDYTIKPGQRNPSQQHKSHLLDHEEPVDLIPSTWYLGADTLTSLRTALSGAGGPQTSRHLTSSEVVSAVVWKHLSLARSLDKLPPETTSLFGTRIDFRSRTKPVLPESYIGNINEPHAIVRMQLKEVCSQSTSQSLAILAMAISDAIIGLNEKHMRQFIGLVNAAPCVTDVVLEADTFPGPDLIVTDTSSLQTRQHSWGKNLGQPTATRTGFRERGVVVFSPQDHSGGFEIQLNCSGVALERLKLDEIFTRYATFRC